MPDDETKATPSGEDKAAAKPDESGDNNIAAKGDNATNAAAKDAAEKDGDKPAAKTKSTRAKAKSGDKAKDAKGEGDDKASAAKAKKPATKTKAAKPRAKVADKKPDDKADGDKAKATKDAVDKTKDDTAAAADAATTSDKAIDKAAGKKPASKGKGKQAKAAMEAEDVARFYGTGRRKEATARVFLRPGNGAFIVNKKPIEIFFPRARSQMVARQALKVMSEHGESGFDVYATVTGGGESGQAEAVRHGVSRAMVEYRPDCKPILRAAGFIARDARAVERKKVGLRKARRARQYSKR